MYKSNTTSLEALAVDNLGARLVVLLLGDPHLLEGGQRRKDRAANPDGVLALGGGHDLDLHGGGGEGGDLLLHALGDAFEHGGTAGKHDIAVKVLADIDVALHDGVVSGSVDTLRLLADQGGLEEDLGAAVALGADSDNLTIGKLVVLLDFRG